MNKLLAARVLFFYSTSGLSNISTASCKYDCISILKVLYQRGNDVRSLICVLLSSTPSHALIDTFSVFDNLANDGWILL